MNKQTNAHFNFFLLFFSQGNLPLLPRNNTECNFDPIPPPCFKFDHSYYSAMDSVASGHTLNNAMSGKRGLGYSASFPSRSSQRIQSMIRNYQNFQQTQNSKRNTSIRNSSGSTIGRETNSQKQACIYCSEHFRNTSDLRQHMKCHTVKPSIGQHQQQNTSVPFELSVNNTSCSNPSLGMNSELNTFTLGSNPAMSEDYKHKPSSFASCANNSLLRSGLPKNRNSDEEAADKSANYPAVTKLHKTTKNKTELKCSECDRTFTCKSHLTDHLRSHSGEKPYQCNQCFKTFAYGFRLKIHQRSHTGERPYPCTYCTKTFTTNSNLKIHIRTHTGERPYSCVYCPRTFARPDTLQEHTRTHTGERPYECSYCSRSFAVSSHLNVHLRCHTGEKPYQCSTCEQTFVSSSRLRVHRRVHSGERPYKCSHCGKCFSHKTTLQGHERTHTGERPFSCIYCNRAFSRQDILGLHIKKHTGESLFNCSYCSKSFTNQSLLRRHTRIHTGDKPFHCERCPKRFTNSFNLKVHMRTHTGEKPYKCPHCGKDFSRPDSLKKHTKTHKV